MAFTDLQVDSGKYEIDHVLPLYRVPLHTCIRVKSLAGVGVHVSRDVSMPFGQGGVLLDLAGQFHHSPCHGG